MPVIRNWHALAAGEFLARTDTPLVFDGLGAGTKASGWDRDFFRAFGDQLVQVRAAADAAGAEIVQQLRPLREFIAALDAGEDGVYAAEWYLFKECPHLVRDVVEGFVPWRWAHQVQNIGESIAVSRFYVSRENYDAALQFFRTTLGIAPALLLRILMGTRAARTFFKRPDVRRALASGRSTAPLRFLMRLAMKPSGRPAAS